MNDTSLKASGTTDTPIILCTAMGRVKGTEHQGIYYYRGLPYAEPPTGELRFAPTKRLYAWSGVLDATKLGPQAVQNGLRDGISAMSEDCLTLNITTPAKPGENTRLPVYVWFHGGAFVHGVGGEPRQDGTSFARKGIIVVTVNYRLGALGLLASKTTFDTYKTTGNWCLLDMLEALRWVRMNIRCFGGDPEKVTIGGESAGSYSVSALIVSPLAEGLFQRAIMESGTILGLRAWSEAQGELEASIAVGADLAAKFGADDSEEGLKKLRACDPQDFARIASLECNLLAPNECTLTPVLDGHVIPKNPYAAITQGKVNKVKVLWGYNGDEGSIFIPEGISADDYKKLAARMFFQKYRSLLLRFPVTKECSATRRARDLVAAVMFTTGMKIFADAMARAGCDVYGYTFTYAPELEKKYGLGARHAVEIPFGFNTLASRDLGSPEEQAIADEMHTRWANFIAEGDPNAGEPAPSGLAWPKWDPLAPQLFRIDQTPEVIDLPERSILELFEYTCFIS